MAIYFHGEVQPQRKSQLCTVGMRNAILGNHLESLLGVKGLKYKVQTLYPGTTTEPTFWCEYLEKGCVHISARPELYSDIVLEHKCERSLGLQID